MYDQNDQELDKSCLNFTSVDWISGFNQSYDQVNQSCVDFCPDPSYLALTPLGYVSGFFIAICGIIINSMTIFVIIKQRNFLKKHRIVPLLFYVTFFELLDCVFGIPLQAFKFYNPEWHKTYEEWPAVCKAIFAPFSIIFQMSVYLLF